VVLVFLTESFTFVYIKFRKFVPIQLKPIPNILNKLTNHYEEINAISGGCGTVVPVVVQGMG
jgi:hypothetical protein